MVKRIKFILTSLFILLTRSYDVYATYLHTPDLQKEANPLASVLGLGWSPLLIIIGVLTLSIIYLYYKATFKPYNLLPAGAGYNFSEVTTYVYLGKTDHWTAMFYKLPKSWQRLQHYLGHILTRGMVYVGVISTTMWLLINYTSFYYKQYHNPTVLYIILGVGLVIITIHYHIQLYKKYRLITSTQ